MRGRTHSPGCKGQHPSPTTRLLICVAVVLGLTNPALAEEKTVERSGTRFRTYVTSPEEVKIFWLDAHGQPFKQFRKLQDTLKAQGKKLKFVMNAGIFEEGGIPSGLLVADGKTQNPLNTNAGRGNFFLQPNGVFYTDTRGGHVVSTTDYRNGVGILPDGRVLFAMTEFGQVKYPNLQEFADFFRAQGCRDALFLDGDISQMVVEPTGPIPAGNYFGAIIAVTE